jgi:HSP20 family protein
MDFRRWNPLDEILTWQNRIGRLADDGFGVADFAEIALPATDVYEEDGNLIVEVSLPNFSENDIEVSVRDGGLEIKAEHQEHQENRRRKYLVRETSNKSFYRYINLPPEAQVDQAQTSFNNGILRVELPLKDRPQPKKLAIGPSQAKPKSQAS